MSDQSQTCSQAWNLLSQRSKVTLPYTTILVTELGLRHMVLT